ncbi:VOC family protein [Janibacter terrae]|uniref:VOC family protein n=1 Tax=Janibacter terrae TaxID=103817 RepID=UPI00381DFD1B
MRALVTGLFVTDVRRAHEFYTRVLGWRDVLVVPDEELCILGPGSGWERGCQLNLEPVEDEVTGAFTRHRYREGLAAIMLAVDDAEMEYRRLKDLGGIVFREELTRDVIGLHFQIEDGCGNILSIHED